MRKLSTLVLAALTLLVASCTTQSPCDFSGLPDNTYINDYFGEDMVKRITDKRLNKETIDQWELGHTPGAPAVQTNVKDWTAEQIQAELRSVRGGMYYTGRINLKEWRARTGPNNSMEHHITALAENIYWDRTDRVFVHGWQGTNVHPSYYTADWCSEILGPEQLKFTGWFYVPTLPETETLTRGRAFTPVRDITGFFGDLWYTITGR